MTSNKVFLHEICDETERETGIHNFYNKYICKLSLDKIFTTDSVYMAACHCAAGFTHRNDTFEFMNRAWLNSYKLAQKVVTGKFKPKYYPEREIDERGKPRTIKPPKFECKVVQKVLCDYILRATLEPKMISTSYASVRGRSIQDMFQNILTELNRLHKDGYIVISDFKGYFGSINTNILCNKFRAFGMDKEVVQLFHSFDPDGVGLSLGNETSQIPASWFASVVDHELKDHYRYKSIFRFMDDILVICKTKEEAKRCIDIIKRVSEKNNLVIKESKTIKYGKEFVFCHEHFNINRKDGYYYRIQNPKNVSNEIRKIKKFSEMIKNDEMTRDAALRQANAVIRNIGTHPNNKKQVKRLNKYVNGYILE